MIVFDVESCLLLFYFEFDKMVVYKMFIFYMTEFKKYCFLTYIIYQRKI